MRMLLLLCAVHHKMLLHYKEAIMLLLKIVLAGLALSVLGSTMYYVICKVEARRGNDTETRR